MLNEARRERRRTGSTGWETALGVLTSEMSSLERCSPYLVDRKMVPVPRVGDPFDHAVSELLHAPGEDGARSGLLSLAGVPFDTTTMARRGSKEGPSAIRQALNDLLSFHGGFEVDLADSGGIVDHGDVDVVETDVTETWARISAVTEALAAQGPPLALLGGDHGLTYPALRGVTKCSDRTIALISLDAHYDVRPDHRGQPASGVPFRYALERLDGSVRADASTQIGIAGWENSAAAASYLKEQGVRTFSSREVHRDGSDLIADEALQRGARADGIWLSVDIDAVDAAFAPGTNAPTIGGLTSNQLLELAFVLAGSQQLCGIDIVEVSPPLDVAGITSLLAAQTLLTVLAARFQAERGLL
jgi:formimidoylglutamase